MSYTRWIGSCRWYTFPHVSGWIQCYGANASFEWMPSETYEQFKQKVQSQVGKDDFEQDEANELFQILDDNMEQIQEDMARFKAKGA